MKTEIFISAINNRNRLKFLYGLNEITIDPYFVTKDKNGIKVIYGRLNNSSEVKRFEYKKISNIKVLNKGKFTPIIPIVTLVS